VPATWETSTFIEGRNAPRATFISTMIETAATYLAMPPEDAIELTAVLQALSDPLRLEIVRGLAAGDERSCGLFATHVAPSTRSHHFKTLREAGVTRTRIAGPRRMVSLRRAELDRRFPGLLDAVLEARR
jgi:DNA-binding transcriptional ArsR family regulator